MALLGNTMALQGIPKLNLLQIAVLNPKFHH